MKKIPNYLGKLGLKIPDFLSPSFLVKKKLASYLLLDFLVSDYFYDINVKEHSHMTSDVWVGRYVKMHLMISDIGRWVGQRGSDIRSAYLEFLIFSVYYFCNKVPFTVHIFQRCSNYVQFVGTKFFR